MNRKIWAVRLPQLESLSQTITERLSDPHHNYYDPRLYGEWFQSFREAAAELRELEPDLFEILPLRELPESSGTDDNDGRGYFTRSQMRKLQEDVGLAISIIRHNAPVGRELTEAFISAGRPFDAYKALTAIIHGATRSVMIEDAHVDRSILDVLEPVAGKVQIRILTRTMHGDFKVAAAKFAQQHGKVEVRTTADFHDRFIVVDGTQYMVGASIKDAGAKGFMFVKVQEPSVVSELEKTLNASWNGGNIIVP